MIKIERVRNYLGETINGTTASDSNRRRWVALGESIFILLSTATEGEFNLYSRFPAIIGAFLLYGEFFRQDYLLGKRLKKSS